MKNHFRCLAILLLLPPLAGAREKKIELPQETATYKPGKGMETAMAYCFTCHSAEYISSQPPLPRKFWEATVIKMKDKFGAPIPDASIQELTDYFTDNYGKK